MSSKIVNCTLKLLQPTRDGKVSLIIVGSSSIAQNLISNQLNNETLVMKIVKNNEIVPFEIKGMEKNAIKFELKFNNPTNVSTPVSLLIIDGIET